MQSEGETADRGNLSGDIISVIRTMIFEGRLPPGERINEVRLANALGVSRTPLREALSALAMERAVASIPRRGFFVQPLTAEEVRNIYPIRALLDPEALKLSGVPPQPRLERLRELAGKLQRARKVSAAIDLDDQWHRVLWADCPNPVLVELIEDFMRRTRRYELASMNVRETLENSSRSKSEILGFLEQKELKKACARLRRSLQDGARPVLDWLSAREAEPGHP